MLNTFGVWATVVPQSSLATTIDYVVTGGTIHNAEFAPELLQFIDFSSGKKILDFGCGVGRNAIPLALKYPECEISVYDNPKMINQMEQFSEQKYKILLKDINNIKIFTNWNEVKCHKFDYIYATLVFQHIYEDAINIYLNDIKQMTDHLVIGGRRLNDDLNKNTWKIIENNGLYPINTNSYKTHGDPNGHQMALYKIQ